MYLHVSLIFITIPATHQLNLPRGNGHVINNAQFNPDDPYHLRICPPVPRGARPKLLMFH
jgi:hypothetical protein